jgi:hypothetical protein
MVVKDVLRGMMPRHVPSCPSTVPTEQCICTKTFREMILCYEAALFCVVVVWSDKDAFVYVGYIMVAESTGHSHNPT